MSIQSIEVFRRFNLAIFTIAVIPSLVLLFVDWKFETIQNSYLLFDKIEKLQQLSSEIAHIQDSSLLSKKRELFKRELYFLKDILSINHYLDDEVVHSSWNRLEQDISHSTSSIQLTQSIDTLEHRIVNITTSDIQKLRWETYTIYLFFIFSLIAVFYIEKKYRNLEKRFYKLEKSLQKRIDREVQRNREKDRLMFQQAKLASLGEMVGNIAHQWRQPLNNLALMVQDIENSILFEGLDKEYIIQVSRDAMEQINYMSSTIDDFRNFFKGDTPKEEFYISEVVEQALNITKNGLQGKGIKLIQDIQDNSRLFGQKSQYIQVLINLVKNGQDIIEERNIQNGEIHIESKEKNGFSYLIIEDNGGGIKEEVIERVFEPYFTTKHQSIGTGLGLYMSKMIIEQNFKGKLEVSNIENGARFSIIVPVAYDKVSK